MPIYNFYLISTLLPLLFYCVERNLSYTILDLITYYPRSILENPFSGVYICLFIIGVSYFILKSINKYKYEFVIKLPQKVIFIFLIYCLIRLFAAFKFTLLVDGLERTQIQFIESTSRQSVLGIFVYVINIFYPLITALLTGALINVKKIYKNSNRYKALFIFMLITLGMAAILNDFTRSSRGNLWVFFSSIIGSYLITHKDRYSFFKLANINSKKFMYSFFISLLVLVFFSSAFIRLSINRVSKDSSLDYLESLRTIPLLHDATLLKVVGGQMVANLAVTNQLYIAPGIDEYPLGERVRRTLFSEQLPRDIYCKEYNCLNLFQPLNLINKYFNDVRDIPVYYPILGRSPFNSSNHVASLCIVFGSLNGIFAYFLVLTAFALLQKSKNIYVSFTTSLTLIVFCLNAFTDNYLVSYYPYALFLAAPLLKLAGCKIQKITTR